MSTERTRATMMEYLRGHGDRIAEDAVFTMAATGETFQGRAKIGQMFEWLYRRAFDARAEIRNVVASDERAIAELDFVGTHVGNFLGVQATGRSVRFPFCVAYDLSGDRITAARIYFDHAALREQLAAESPQEGR